MDYLHSSYAAPAAKFSATGWDIFGSAQSPNGAAGSTRGVLVSALGEKKQVLVAPEADFAALVEGRYTSPAIPAQARTIVGVVAQPPIQGTPDPKPKRRSKKDAPWFLQAKGMDVTLSISKLAREFALQAADRAGVLGFQLTVFITLAPDIDDLSPRERLQFWRKCLNRLRAYCRQREKKLGCPFPAIYLATRESDPVTHLSEHLHLLAHAPDRAEADHMAEVVRKWFVKKRKKAITRGGAVEEADDSADDDAVEETEGASKAHAKRVDTRERFRGGKLRSIVKYVFKAAHPQSWKFDSTILWKRSGAIAGQRVFISRNITNREVVAATRDAVAAVELARQGLIQAGRDAIVPAPAAVTAASPPAKVVVVEIHAAAVSDVPAAPAPVLAAAVEPGPCLTPGSAPSLHRKEAEHRDMDVAEIETRPAAIEPAPVPHEPAVLAAIGTPAMVGAHAEAVESTEDAISPAPPVFVTANLIAPVTKPTTAATLLDIIPEPGPTSSSSNSVLAALAGVGRSVARGVVAGAGWISSRLGVRSPSPTPSASLATDPPPPARRAPLFDLPSFISAGAFFGPGTFARTRGDRPPGRDTA